ncbi:MAG: glycosyltransferase, exosortase A system-associated [Acidobacteria bacterium]|nr:glycosyltransferase, exosortase A system-associated [Acidobacteriota bacterium]MBI3422426.1 glycosyltransferase, exosortase A system-associated [Acidobacteriota bacterium]
MRVLHVLDHSLPYFSGYSFRSDYIIRTQQRLGLQPIVVTSPKHEDFTEAKETRDGIAYYRLNWPAFYVLPKPHTVPLLKQAACVAEMSKQLTKLAAELKVDLLHAHSPSLNGLAASRAARQLGLPCVYEVRYYEEDAAVDRKKLSFNSPLYRLSRRLEWEALKRADRVVTICEALKDDLIARGVPASKVFQAPNGVDTKVFTPRAPDTELIARYGLQGKTVIGFIGSLYLFEGLEFLVDAVLQLLNQRADVKLLLAGEGEVEASLRSRIPADKHEQIIFAGKVPHPQVKAYYSVMDVLVYPRVRSRLTELTTPLKPLEAMAQQRVVVGSNIGGLRELIRDGETGCLVEPENVAALTQCLAALVNDKGKRQALAQRGREFVVRERDWERIVERYLEIYGGLAVRQQTAVA